MAAVLHGRQMPTEFVDADNKNVYFVPAIEQLAWYQRAPVAAWVYEVCFDAPIDPNMVKRPALRDESGNTVHRISVIAC